VAMPPRLLGVTHGADCKTNPIATRLPLRPASRRGGARIAGARTRRPRARDACPFGASRRAPSDGLGRRPGLLVRPGLRPRRRRAFGPRNGRTHRSRYAPLGRSRRLAARSAPLPPRVRPKDEAIGGAPSMAPTIDWGAGAPTRRALGEPGGRRRRFMVILLHAVTSRRRVPGARAARRAPSAGRGAGEPVPRPAKHLP